MEITSEHEATKMLIALSALESIEKNLCKANAGIDVLIHTDDRFSCLDLYLLDTISDVRGFIKKINEALEEYERAGACFDKLTGSGAGL